LTRRENPLAIDRTEPSPPVTAARPGRSTTTPCPSTPRASARAFSPFLRYSSGAGRAPTRTPSERILNQCLVGGIGEAILIDVRPARFTLGKRCEFLPLKQVGIVDRAIQVDIRRAVH